MENIEHAVNPITTSVSAGVASFFSYKNIIIIAAFFGTILGTWYFFHKKQKKLEKGFQKDRELLKRKADAYAIEKAEYLYNEKLRSSNLNDSVVPETISHEKEDIEEIDN